MKRPASLMLLLLALCCPYAQAQRLPVIVIETGDISRFWQAYDQVSQTPDSLTQCLLIQHLYLDQASIGLKALIKRRRLSATDWCLAIREHPRFWASIRPLTQQVEKKAAQIRAAIAEFKVRYPPLTSAGVYFVIGCMRTGGTVSGRHILIGSEIALADRSVDTTSIPSWLKNVFYFNDNIVFSVIHEYVHIQQVKNITNARTSLLAECLVEGAADFIAERVTGKKLAAAYATYGRSHEKELWQSFRQEMNEESNNYWLHGGADSKAPVMDLGYYMGYVICRSYYQKTANKQAAFAAIIRLKYYDRQAVNRFYRQAGIPKIINGLK